MDFVELMFPTLLGLDKHATWPTPISTLPDPCLFAHMPLHGVKQVQQLPAHPCREPKPAVTPGKRPATFRATRYARGRSLHRYVRCKPKPTINVPDLRDVPVQSCIDASENGQDHRYFKRLLLLSHVSKLFKHLIDPS